MTRTEINERLVAMRGQLDTIAAEVDEITNGATPRLGCRVSYIKDRLQLAVEEINASLEYPDE